MTPLMWKLGQLFFWNRLTEKLNCLVAANSKCEAEKKIAEESACRLRKQVEELTARLAHVEQELSKRELIIQELHAQIKALMCENKNLIHDVNNLRVERAELGTKMGCLSRANAL